MARAAPAPLVAVDAAEQLGDLRVPPGNRLQKLRGDRAGQHSIRVNEHCRICFRRRDGNSHEVEIVDYHESVRGWCRMAARKLNPIHPGDVLATDFLEPLGLSQYRLARDISVPPRRINEVVHGTRGISADSALRLARYFGTSDRSWLNLQARYDLEMERDHLGARLAKEVRVLAPAI